jgi:hypothetical protein
MALGARVDPLLSELATCTTQAEGPAIKASTLEVGLHIEPIHPIRADCISLHLSPRAFNVGCS